MNNKKLNIAELNGLINHMIQEEINNMVTIKSDSIENKEPRKEEHDHEGRMARSEIRDMLLNGMKLYKLIGPDDELPGWVSSYISLASDYIHSVTEYMIQDKIDSNEE